MRNLNQFCPNIILNRKSQRDNLFCLIELDWPLKISFPDSFYVQLKKVFQNFSSTHPGMYPILCKHIMNPFTLLINWVIFSMRMFSTVHIQFYHILQIRIKRTYFRLLLKLNICTKGGGKYLKVQWFYRDYSKSDDYAVFQTKPGNTDLQTSTLNVSCIQNFLP